MHAWGGIWDPLNTDGQPCLEEQAARWLKALSMDMYTGQLLQQGVRSLEDMQYVSDDIMNVCGFNPIEKAKFIARRPDRRIRESVYMFWPWQTSVPREVFRFTIASLSADFFLCFYRY